MSDKTWIEIAPVEEATGDLRRAYDKILSTRGRIPHIRSVMANEPLVVEGFAYFYPDNNYACRSIDRRLSEMIATVVSVANVSKLAGPAHADLLAKVTGDRSFAESILNDYALAGLSAKERTLLDYVSKLTKTPGAMDKSDIERLRAEGWTDPQIVATVHVTAFFAYMNRIAEALGVTQP
jgi:uncharacterized peroxidase-related enzyme